MLRGRIGDVWRALFTALGRYEPITSDRKDLVLSDRISFSGDVPVQIADGRHEQGRMVFRQKRPECEEAQNLVVTPSGAGWAKGRLYECYSAGAPGIRNFFKDRHAAEAVPKGYHVQSAHKDTYGDWVSEYLCAILRQEKFDAPLFLPREFAQRDYVTRDLEALGVDWRPIERPLKIKSATVLRQQKHFVHFGPADVEILGKMFSLLAAEAKKGGVIYLSRKGEISEVAQRYYPHDIIEQVVEAHGGRIIRTAKATCEDYRRAAPHAETVIFDHGSAYYNSLRWPVRRAIEIVSDDWWNNAFLMLSDARGIRDYTIIRGDLGEQHVREALERALARPLDQTGKT
jgi:hypothetical protein